MPDSQESQVRLCVHLASPAPKVFDFLSTDSGCAAFWADSAVEEEGTIHFRFGNGMEHRGKIHESIPSRLFSVEYFGGSTATFELVEVADGGTDVTLVETGIPAEWYADQHARWVSVLLALKAAVDFSIDLRNHDPARRWEDGFVDV